MIPTNNLIKFFMFCIKITINGSWRKWVSPLNRMIRSNGYQPHTLTDLFYDFDSLQVPQYSDWDVDSLICKSVQHIHLSLWNLCHDDLRLQNRPI